MNAPRLTPMRSAWPREKIIAQWERVLHDPKNARYPIVRQIAQEALANLHAESEREVGSDDA